MYFDLMLKAEDGLALGCKIINESEEKNITGSSSKGMHISNNIKLKPSKILIFRKSFEDWSAFHYMYNISLVH